MTTSVQNRLESPQCADQEDVRQLLKQVAAGDRVAFQEFYRRFHGMVYATAIQVLYSDEDAADCTQEVFESLWRKARLYLSDKGKPSTWLAAMARNRAIDKLRARQRRSKLNDRFEREQKVEPLSTRSDPSSEAETADLGSKVREAVAQLSTDQAQAIRMAYFSGLTQSEIAAETGEPLGTIKARIRRGLARLRQVVDEADAAVGVKP